MVNRVGFPRTTFRTFLSFSHFHAFCDGDLGMVWDFNEFSMDDSFNVDEGEQAIGFHISITTMFGTSKGACR